MTALGSILLIIGCIISLIFTIKLIVIAFQESTAWGLMYLFIPFASLYYIITRWQKCKSPFLKSLISLPFIIIGYVLIASGQQDAINQAVMYGY